MSGQKGLYECPLRGAINHQKLHVGIWKNKRETLGVGRRITTLKLIEQNDFSFQELPTRAKTRQKKARS